jgi:hypothetical protein
MESGHDPTAGAAILEKAKLDFFTASPAAIGPFGKSTLSWSVSGPSDFGVLLNGQQVSRAGHMEVEPRVTTPYRLEVNYELERRTLETLSIEVDVSTCAIVPMARNLGPSQTVIPGVLALVLNNQPTLTIPTQRVVGANGEWTDEPVPQELSFSLGTMHIALHLEGHAHHLAPNVDINIDTGFTVDENGALQTVNTQISGKVSDTWLLDLVPVYGLIVSLNEGAQDTKFAIELAPVVQALPTFVELSYSIDPKTQRYQTVVIPGDPAPSPFLIVACAKPLEIAVGPKPIIPVKGADALR